MADTRVLDLTGLTTPSSGDYLHIIDVLDSTMSPGGTDKKITLTNYQAYLASLTQILTNKTFDTGGAGNVLKIAGTQVSAVTGTGSVVLGTSPTLTTPTIAQIVNTGTLTLPTTSDTLVGRATTDTLTNKTLTSPVINVTSDAQGDIYYRNGSGLFSRLAPGTSGQVLKTQGASANPIWDYAPKGVYCSVYVSASQSIPNNSSTAVAFDITEEDATSMHSNSVNNTRITASIAGLYLFAWKITYAANSTGRRLASLRKNAAASNIIGTDWEIGNTANASNQSAAFGTKVIRMAANDYMEVMAYQNSGGSLAIGSVIGGQTNEDVSFFQATLIGI